jgi:hypothetical protein
MSVAMMTIEDHTGSNRAENPDLEAAATVELRARSHVVRALPHLVGAEERKTPLLDLVAWYERVVESEQYATAPPIEGLDALVDELALVTVPLNVLAELARARWAIRVAEELVKWRCLRESDGSSAVRFAADRLQRTIEQVRNDAAPLSSRSQFE